MKKVSVSLNEGHVDLLDERQQDGSASSRSEALRQLLGEYEELRTECEELRTECERLENRRDELRNQLQARGEVEEKVETLVEKTERQEDALAEALKNQQEIRREQRAGVVTRARRWLFGRPSTNGDGRGNGTDADADTGAVEEDG